MEELISVIVPVYNVEQYVESCITSIVKQSYKKLEIILINDGSLDSSGAICQKIQLLDSRIKYYEKKNSGLSDTRNFGIEKATGKFIAFVDSDDILATDSIAYLYSLLKKNKSQMSISSIHHFIDGENPKFTPANDEVVYTKAEALLNFLYQKDISTSACGKLYDISLWNNIRFPSGKLFEDNIAIYQILCLCDKVAYGNAMHYGYRHRKNSITTNKFTVRDLDILDIGKEILKYSKEINDAVYKAAISYQCSNCFRVYLSAPDSPDFEKAIIYCKSYIKNNYKKVLKDKNIRKKLRIALILFSIRLPRKAMILFHGKAKRW